MKDSRSFTAPGALGSSTPALERDVAEERARRDPALSDLGSDELGQRLARCVEEEEERRGVMKGTEERLRKSLYQPSEDLLALSSRFIGAAMEVHSYLGSGFTEVIYGRALRRELQLRAIPFESEVSLDVAFKGEAIGEFRVDLIIDDRLVVELKAVESITTAHVSQTISYLRASGLRFGLIINFNVPRLSMGIRRVLWSG